FAVASLTSGWAQEFDLDSLQQVLKQEISPQERIKTLIQLSKSYRGINPNEARPYATKAILLAEQEQETALLYDAYASLVPIIYLTDLDSALRLTERIQQYGIEQQDTVRIMQSLLFKGVFAYQAGEFEKAKAAYQEAITLTDKSPNFEKERATLYSNLAVAEVHLDNYAAAIPYYFSALEYYQGTGSDFNIGMTYNNIGVAYYNQQSYPKALEYYELAHQYYSKTNQISALLQAKNNIANTYVAMDQPDKILEAYQEILNLSEKSGNQADILAAKVHLAYFHATQEPIQREIVEVLLAETQPFSAQLSQDDARLLQLSEILLLKDARQYRAAILRLERLRDQRSKSEAEYISYQDMGLLAELYAEVGEHRKAYEAHKVYKSISDSFINAQNLTELKLQEADFRFAQEQELLEESYRTEQINSERDLRFRNILSVGLIVALLLALGWGYSIFQANKQRKQYAAQLEKEVDHKTSDLQRANRKLEQLNYELSTFSFIASHDIKEPIQGIGESAQQIFQQLPLDLQTEYQESFAVIQRSSKQLYQLVNDFTGYTAMSQDQDIELEPVDLHHLLTNIIETFGEGFNQYRGKIMMSRLPVINSHPALLFTAIKNIIENGLKFNEERVPSVQIAYESNDRFHEISIQDNGIGIQAEYQSEIFGMFKRLHPQGQYEGSGIGLAIARLSIQKLKGDIRVESQTGEGSKFIISLPIV
ncbi:MAG: tetratricopeptide repeat protein, partial [Bacteroidota bacterium]